MLKQALVQVLLLHCDLSSPCLRPSSILRRREYPREDHHAQLQLPLAVEEHHQEAAGDQVVVVDRQHPSVAWAEAEAVQCLEASVAAEEVHRCLA